jgi:hypothetical protein
LAELQVLREEVRKLRAIFNTPLKTTLKTTHKTALKRKRKRDASPQSNASKRANSENVSASTTVNVVNMQVKINVQVKVKTHRGTPRQAGPVFVAPVVALVGDALVGRRVLRCLVAQTSRTLTVTVPSEQVHHTLARPRGSNDSPLFVGWHAAASLAPVTLRPSQLEHYEN